MPVLDEQNERWTTDEPLGGAARTCAADRDQLRDERVARLVREHAATLGRLA